MANKIFKARYPLITDEQAQEIGEEIELRFPQGNVDPEALVGFAKETNSPLHKYFEWDDRQAAKKYRLDQARKLIKSIAVVIEDREIPAYHRVTIAETGVKSYLDVKECLNSDDLWSQVLKTALDEANRWSDRYQSYEELAPIREQIKQTEREVLRHV